MIHLRIYILRRVSYYRVYYEKSRHLFDFFIPKRKYIIDIHFSDDFNKYYEFEQDMNKFSQRLKKFGFKDIKFDNREPMESWAGSLSIDGEDDPYKKHWKIEII